MKLQTLIFFLFTIGFTFAQTNPVNCDLAIPGCTTPSFGITGVQPPENTIDFTGASNPSTNPNPQPGNSGCLLSGETVSTFITISVVQSGTLEWSIQGSMGGCFDWIMWPYTPGVGGATSPTCGQLLAGSLPPVACNWNGMCQGFTGMASPSNLPTGADWSDFEYALNVVAGQTFLLCLSNYSFTNQNVDFSFFGTADVSCTPSVTDQIICNGDTAHVIFNTGGIISPQYTWTPNTGVDDPTNGPDFDILINDTTSYQVQITDATSTYDTTLNFTITVVYPPTPNAGTDFSVCQGNPAQLVGTPSNSSDALSWSFTGPSGTPAPPNALFSPNNTAEDPSVQVNYMGTYTFTFSEDNGVCPPATDAVDVTFGNLVQTHDKTNPICADSCNGSITVHAIGATLYSIDGGATWQSDSVFTDLCAGIYNVTSKNTLGCTATPEGVTLTNPTPPTVDAGVNQIVCVNDTATLIAAATGGTAFSYHWQHTTDTNAQQIVTPLNPPTYYFVVAENQDGCFSVKDSVKVEWRPLLTGTISLNDTVCPGDTSMLHINNVSGGLAPYSFMWKDGSGNMIGNTDTIVVNPSQTTTYYVHITDVCTTPETVLNTTVVIAPIPKPSFTVDTAEQCQPGKFTLVNTSTLSKETYWMITNGTAYINQDTVVIHENEPDEYDVRLIVASNQGCRDTLYKDNFFIVHEMPRANFFWAPQQPKMFSAEVTFTNATSYADYYNWTFTEGTPATSSKENPKINFPDGVIGDYPVYLKAWSEFGCVDSVKHIIHVVSDVILYVPNTFTPDNDNFNETWKIHIHGIDVYDFVLKVYNRWGEILWESHDPSAAWDGTYGGKTVPDGTYIWIIQTKDMVTDNKYEYKGQVTILR